MGFRKDLRVPGGQRFSGELKGKFRMILMTFITLQEVYRGFEKIPKRLMKPQGSFRGSSGTPRKCKEARGNHMEVKIFFRVLGGFMGFRKTLKYFSNTHLFWVDYFRMLLDRSASNLKLVIYLP